MSLSADSAVRRVLCVDVGSTFTKATLVDLSTATVAGHAEHRTTIDTDVLDGVDACVAALGAEDVPVLACSSAGGGLRVAVVGNEELVTAEAGRRVALSSGGKVVAVVAAADGGFTLADLAEPDVVLLTGGTDGGNAEVILAAATALVGAGWRGPVVVAGNADAAAEVTGLLAGLPVVVADNVVPQIGVLRPEGARAAIREVFLSHVIGGKQLSARDDGAAFVGLVRGATPDVVLTGVEVLAREAGDVVVVDVGGATTDVHSVVDLDPEDGALARDVVAPTAVTRTVEGDLGMRWSALTTVDAGGRPDLEPAARTRAERPAYLPESESDRDDDETIARLAVGLALRRHAGRSRVVVGPEGRVVERTGTDLREVGLVVASGGVLRHGRPGAAARVLEGSLGADLEGGWQLPERPRVVVDGDYVLAAVGLLAADHPDAACRLARSLLRVDR
ncbi:glutamate mutase L [Nocardioides sp.]|uniref:glutamate mutase L n=1 Tax=Nocardioides sp. TaxID=35761 RepID=UPI00271C5F64|nr:glutamate mutase L [Nocardioides sp.]MDO9456909.1 glutamate mutase L [Nocardioides sp.]